MTRAWLLVFRSTRMDIGGIQKRHPPSVFNHFAFRVEAKSPGHRMIVMPFVALFHDEPSRRDGDDTQQKKSYFRREGFAREATREAESGKMPLWNRMRLILTLMKYDFSTGID